MSRWFRFYTDAMRDPKIAKLSDADFRLWTELLSVAGENEGLIPPLEDLKHLLRRRLDHLKRGVDRLIRGSLIEVLSDGYIPSNWKKLQYISDSSTKRVQKHREKCNVSVTPPETETDTETESITCTTEVVRAVDENEIKPEHIVEKWNDFAKQISRPQIKDLTPSRRQLVKARISQYSLDDFVDVFEKIRGSPFLRGDKTWSGVTFDWAFKAGNFQKIIEGNYDE